MSDPNFALPEGANEEVRKIHKAIMDVVDADAYSGGCRGFYTIEEWKARGESYGIDAPLIVVHDGGDLAHFFNWDYGDSKSIGRMSKALEAIGYWPEQCTSWYTAIYKEER